MISSPTNDDRAAWAAPALDLFARETFGGRAFRELLEEGGPGGDAPDAIADLICDLMHLARRLDFDPSVLVERAVMNFEAEEEEAAET